MPGHSILLDSARSVYNATAPPSTRPLLAPLSLLCPSRAAPWDLGVQVTCLAMSPLTSFFYLVNVLIILMTSCFIFKLTWKLHMFQQVEYVPVPSIALDGSGSACICYIPCTIHATVTDPPRCIRSGIDLDSRVFGATFALSTAAPSVQVVINLCMDIPLQRS
jgi:hypothetical protein